MISVFCAGGYGGRDRQCTNSKRPCGAAGRAVTADTTRTWTLAIISYMARGILWDCDLRAVATGLSYGVAIGYARGGPHS